MALWYVDTTAGGANNGTSAANAWTNIRSAFEWGAYTAGDIIYVRRNQTHTMTDAACAVGDSGTFGVPIRMIGDQDALDIWADAGDVLPIIDWGAFSRYVQWNGDDYWELRNLEFTGGKSYTILASAHGVGFYNCKWTSGGQTPLASIYANSIVDITIEDCIFAAAAVKTIIFLMGILRIKDCTFDGATTYAIESRGVCVLENCVFGGTVQNATDVGVMAGRVIGRNVTLNGAVADIVFLANDRGYLEYVAIEDYNGVKGAWRKEYYHGTMDSFASAGTVAGARANGCITAVRAVAAAVVSAYAPLLIHEYACEVTAGTLTVDVFIQPSGWAAVPVTQGAASDIWVEVAAWDVATGEYLYFDSRDEGAQDAQVNDTWENIRVTGVAADLGGNVIVRVYQIRGDGADIIYVDRIIEVS